MYQRLIHLSVLAGRKELGDYGLYKWKGTRRAHTVFLATALRVPALWLTGVGDS